MKNVSLLNNPVLEYRPDSSVPVNIAAVADRIAGVLRNTSHDSTAQSDTYYVPFAAVHEPLARQVGITGRGDLYGGIVKAPQHADKAILHELPDPIAESPEWYSQSFAKSLGDVALPGFTTFSPNDTITAYNHMRQEGLRVRFKDPASTGGLGQRLVDSHQELSQVMSEHGQKFSNVGAILEADLADAVTVTVGYVDLAGQIYTWHGRPYDIEYNNQTRFGGNELTVVRGGFRELRKQCDNSEDLLAVYQAEKVFNAYSTLGATVTRATFDAVQGVAANGAFLSGITDPSLRPSASSAAEIRAIEAFVDKPEAQMAKTRLVYDYAKQLSPAPGSSQEIFIAHDRMNIYVELLEVI